MIWQDWNQFLHMGGYGFYVWGSVLVTAALVGGELFLLRQRGRAALKRARLAVELDKEADHEDAA